jgi:Flp pilus assembly CpaE family ATPase
MPIYSSQNTVLRKKAKSDPDNSRKAGKSAKIISFINLKGGVGKTTLCLTIGEILSFGFSRKVLLIDLDSQSNLSSAIVGLRGHPFTFTDLKL